MRSNGPAFVSAILALAFAITISIATPPGALKQATALLGFWILKLACHWI
jgi:hypothetical protein